MAFDFLFGFFKPFVTQVLWGSPFVFIGVRVTRSLVFCAMFCRSLFFLLFFFFWYWLSYLIDGFWFPISYLQTFLDTSIVWLLLCAVNVCMWIMELLQLQKTTDEPYDTIRTNIINGIHGCVLSLYNVHREILTLTV